MTTCAVIGGASNAWDDFRALEELVGGTWGGLVICVNDMMVHWPHRMDAAVTLHPEKLAKEDPDHSEGWSWVRQRAEAGLPAGYVTFARRRPDLVHEVVQHWGGGSSGAYGVTIAHHLGSEKTVLCGIPLDARPCFEESGVEHTVSEHLKGYRRAWERRLSRPHRPHGRYLRDHTRSISGWTRELLGAPTLEWLNTPSPLPTK